MMLDEEQIANLAEGIKLFNEGEFFDSHEYFESLWQASQDELAEQFLFLVRLAAGGVHLVNSNFSSLFLFQLAQKQLQNGLQINVLQNKDLNEGVAQLIKQLEGASRAELPEIAKNFSLKLVSA